MIKRVVEISRHPSHLAVRNEQLLIRRHVEDESAPLEASIPCEDIGMVVVDHAQSTYSHYALAKLSEHGAVVVICGKNHLPVSIILPFASHSEVVKRAALQVKVSKALHKRLWKQLVVSKIKHQALSLPQRGPVYRKLKMLCKEVRSGDPSNCEAQAAKSYWRAWLGEENSGFRRNNNENDFLNAALNYGYTILRAAIARAIVAGGLHPVFGIHHKHRANMFCLADDLLEPLRPLIDKCVRELHTDQHSELTQEVKAELLKTLTETVGFDGQSGPLMVQLHRYVASLVACYEDKSNKLIIPVLMDDKS